MDSRRIDYFNILLGMAYLGALTRNHIQRLWGLPERTAERVIARLQGKESKARGDELEVPAPLIASSAWYVPGADGKPKRKAFVYSLTEAGHALIKRQDQYPRKPPKFRDKLLEHDMRTVETIVRLIELARPADLSGVNIEMELRLDPKKLRPRADALVIMQLGGGYSRPDLVPWSKDPAIADETRERFAIESDNDTEPRAIIRAKAETYAAIRNDPEWRAWWYEQHGAYPTVLWVVPSYARLGVIQAEWTAGCPRGDWAITTDLGLKSNEWVGLFGGKPKSGNWKFRIAPRPTPAAPAPVLPRMLTPEERAALAQQQREEAARKEREALERQEREVREREELALRQQQLEEKLKAQRVQEAQEQQARYEQEQRAQQRRAAEEERLRLARLAEEARQEQARQAKAQAEARRRRNEALLKWGTLPLWGPFVALAWVAQGLVGMHGTDENLAARFIAAGGVFAVLYFGLLTPLFRVIDKTLAPPATPAAQDCGRWAQVEPIPLRYAPSLAAAPVISRMTGDEVLTSLCTTQLVDEVVDGHQHSITWLHVRLTPNIEGWVNQEFLEPAEE